MKKVLVCMALTLALIVVTQRQVRKSIVDAATAAFYGEKQAEPAKAGAEKSFSEQLGAAAVNDTLDVTLYYRYGDTNLLGRQSVTLDLRREQTVARSMVEKLIEGPDAAHERLTGLFPRGTEVISVTGDGNTAFVTLSRDFLGKPDGAPSDWEDLEIWQEEAALRRNLAVQSLVLALTEDARYQRVQLYVADSDDDVPERVEMYWFDRTQNDLSVVLGACARDEQVMLTPAQAMKLILEAWQSRDWEALHALLAQDAGGHLPALGEFETLMKETDVSLLEYSISGGTVSMDGQRATLVLDAQVRSVSGGDALISRESVPLVRYQDNWAIAPDTLIALMIRD